MADVSRTVDIIFLAKDEVSAPVNEVEAALGGVTEETKKASEGTDKLNTEIEKTGGAPLTAVKLLGLALGALAVGLVADKFTEANSEIENFTKAMEFATGSTEEAAKELAFIRQISDDLGIELLSTAGAYAKYTAATAQSALTTEEARDIFVGVAGAISATGGSAAEVEGALRQLQQGISKTVFDMEDLKSLAERIPGFFKRFAAALEVTEADLFDLIETSQIGTEEIAKLGVALKKSIEDVDFDTFTNAANRFKNAVTDLNLALGDTGAYDLLKDGVVEATDVVEGLGTGIVLLQEKTDISLKVVAEKFASLLPGVNLLTASLELLPDSLEEIVVTAKRVPSVFAEIVDEAEKIPDPIQDAVDANADLVKSTNEVNKILKALGVDEDKLVGPIIDVVAEFDNLLDKDLSGDQLLQGLVATLSQLDDADLISAVRQDLVDLVDEGGFNSDILREALDAITASGDNLAGNSEDWIKILAKFGIELEDTGDSAEEAEKKVAKTHLELEKLASNERIKNIEARVNLDIAKLEADADVAVAIIEGLSDSIGATAKLIGDLFGALTGADNLRQEFAIEKQIDLENDRRQQQLDQQEQLNNAQIRKLNAETKALRDGDPVITVNGDGLQPHLEAFMFEILESIQVRVNADGLQQLLGVA